MNPQPHAIRLGLFRGWTEFRQSVTTRSDQVWIVSVNGIFIAVMLFQRNAKIPGTDLSLALATLPSLLGMNVMTGGWMQSGG
jgi:ABC-2 type transport system permease protein